VGYQGKGLGRPIYEVLWHGKMIKVAVTVGSNGYMWERTSVADQPRLRISAEYLCYPTWVSRPGGGVDNPAPADLGLPAELAADLDAWSDEFDAIFPEDDPGSAAFASPDDERAFYARGRQLADQVATAVGNRYHVTFLGPASAAEITLS
jgi:hypothetical protein